MRNWTENQMMLAFIWHSGNIGRYGKYHMAAFFMGFLLDLMFGDPYWFPHPVRLIGRLITGCEKVLRGAAAECFMTYQILVVKCLKVESMKVCQCLKKGNPEQAKQTALNLRTMGMNNDSIAKAVGVGIPVIREWLGEN